MVVSFSILVQTPFIQGYLIAIATEQAEKSLGMDVAVGTVDISFSSRSLTIHEITGETEGVKITCKSLQWSELWDNNRGKFALGSALFDTVHVSIQSLEDAQKIARQMRDSNGGEVQEHFIRSLVINNLIFELQDQRAIEIDHIACENIEIHNQDVVLNLWSIHNGSLTMPGYDSVEIEKSSGFLSVMNGEVDCKIHELISKEGNLSAEVFMNKNNDLSIPKLSIDANAHLLAKRFEKYLDKKTLDILTNLASEKVTCDLSFLENELIVHRFLHDQIVFSGKLGTTNDKIDWEIKATLDSKISEPWTGKLLQENIEIDLDITGSQNDVQGTFVSDLTAGYFTLDWRNGEMAGSINCDSTWTSKGIVENLYAEFTWIQGAAEVSWESDLHDVSIEYDSWKLSSHLVGHTTYRGGFQDATLSFTKPLLKKNSSTPPIDFGFCKLDISLDGTQVDIDIKSDIMDANLAVNIEEKKWMTWLETSKTQTPENTNFDGFLTQGTCTVYQSAPFLELFHVPLVVADEIEAVWSISVDQYQAEITSDWISIKDIQLKKPVINLSGGSFKNSMHAEILEVNKNELLIAKKIDMELLGDSAWTYICNWENAEKTKGLLKIYGEKKDAWEFNLLDAIIPMGMDTLAFFDITGRCNGNIDNPFISISGEGKNLSYANEIIPYTKVHLEYFEGQVLVENKMSGFGLEGAGKIETNGFVDLNRLDELDLDLETTLVDFPMNFANKLLNENTAKLDGTLDGDFTIRGSYQNPEINGEGVLKEAVVEVSYLGTEYYANGKFNVLPYGIELNGIQVQDPNGGEATLVGTAIHEGYKKWNLDVSLNIEDETKPLDIMNIPNSPDAYFYGTGKATGDINVFGYDGEMTIEARLKTFEGTDFVLPMETATSSTWSTFVEFIDHDVTEQSDEVNPKKKTSVNLDLIIDVQEESKARIIFDEAVGDEIVGRCQGIIHLALDDLERLSMYGSLEIIEGDYLFTLYNFINKKFIAEPGGTIKWFGNPYEAEIDVKTSYSTRTSLLPISPESADEGKKKVDLVLNLNGNLMRPGIKFDIELPESNARTKATLATLISNEEEMNRQALSLLVLQQFLPPEWQAAAIGSTGLQENSTELISSQFGNWLSGISEDVNVGIDYDAGSKAGDESALAVALSTQLLDDRLHVEGEVGTDRLNTGAFEDVKLRDVRLRYDINKDGSLQLTGYSSQRSTIPGLEGESVQGVGILFHKDFNKFMDIFKRN